MTKVAHMNIKNILNFLKELLPYVADFLRDKYLDKDSDWSKALDIILKHEMINNHNLKSISDVAYYGVSLPFLKEAFGDDTLNDVVDEKQALDLNKKEDIKKLKSDVWEAQNYNKIGNLSIATLLLDLGLNIGVKQANKLLQQAYNGLVTDGVLLKIDGDLGEVTLSAVNEYLNVDAKLLFLELRDAAISFYQGLSESDNRFSEFLQPWLNRIYDHIFK